MILETNEFVFCNPLEKVNKQVVNAYSGQRERGTNRDEILIVFLRNIIL